MQVCAARGTHVSSMVDVMGPEIHTSLLRGGADVELVQGQAVTVVAVGKQEDNAVCPTARARIS